MKKITTVLSVAVLAVCLIQSAHAQYHDSQTRIENVFKMNPFSLVAGSFTFFYEHKVSDASTLQLGINFMPEPLKAYSAAFSCFGLTPEYRIYLSHMFANAPGGGYIAPFTRWRCITISAPDLLSKYWKGIIRDDQFAVGMVLGYQYITSGTISFDFFAGPFLNSNNINLPVKIPMNNELAYLGPDGLGFRVGAAIGFGF